MLAVLMDTKGDQLLDKEHRERAAHVLDTTIGSISTYLKRLKDKKAITHNKGKYEFSKLFQNVDIVEISLLRGA